MNNLIVKVGDQVEVLLNGQKQKLKIVESYESAPEQGRVSFLSPLGEALIGQSYTAKVHFAAPNGQIMECQLLRPAM